MSNEHPQAPRIEGPFYEPDRYRLVFNETIVPRVYLTRAADGERFHLHLDGRWMTEEVTEREVLTFLPIIANGMAVAGGFTHHGPESKPANPHVTRLGLWRPPLEVVSDD